MLCVIEDRLGRQTSITITLLQRPLPVKARGRSPLGITVEEVRTMWLVQVAHKHLTQGGEEKADSQHRVNQ